MVVCRLALHHMVNPERVVREMTRVCKADGTVLVEDIYGSEQPERAAYQDRWEVLRDRSHVKALPISEMLRIFSRRGTGDRRLDDL